MINFSELEEQVLARWREHDIFKKTLAAREGQQSFVVFEGPPTANAKPALHHVLARAFKDVIPRFKTMQGYYVARKAGWDTHGLPVELQIEKKLGFTGKAQIEEYGIKEFNAHCKEAVWEFKGEWEKLTERIAYWLDMERPYVTYDNDYIESVWWALQRINEQGYLYLGHRVVPQCGRCGTALSSHEVAQGYKTVHDASVYVKFPVKGVEKTYFLAWTTTPWTLPGNLALAVNPALSYVKVQRGDESFYCAADLAETVFGDNEFTALETMSGADLLGMEYVPLFPDATQTEQGREKSWRVVAADYVTADSGTGVVHTAPMYGEEDYATGVREGLPLVHTVGEDGMFLPSVAQWVGRFAKDKAVEREIITDLESRGLLLREQDYEHEYPFCWRCDTPLLYYAKSSWFIRMDAVKEKMIAGNATVNWTPSHIRDGRFGEWLKNVRDWAISRERYWGTPLPIWQCEGGHRRVIGSVEELRTTAKNFSEVYPEGVLDLHRPFIDEVQLDCVECGATMIRVKEVLDVWFDSGVMPFAQQHFPFENQAMIEQNGAYPADYISEAIDQTRGWFYTLLAVSSLLGYEVPYRNVICLGHINDARGQKMSKSKGNVVDPWELIAEHGADAVRMYLFTVNQPGDAKRFDRNEVREVVRETCLVLWNVLTFYELFAQGIPENEEVISTHPLDCWIMSRLHVLTRDTTRQLEEYQIFEAGRGLQEFVTELSTWYVRRSRDRFKAGGAETMEAVCTLRVVLLTLSKLMAPMMPFLADEVYLRVAKSSARESVHLEDWPQWSTEGIDEALLSDMAQARKSVELLHALRAEVGIKVRQPLATAWLSGDLSELMRDIVADEVNVLSVQSGAQSAHEEGVVVKTDAGVTVALDTRITDELAQAGVVRELVRQINALRKAQRFTIQDRARVVVKSENSMVQAVITDRSEELCSATLSDAVTMGDMADMTEVAVRGDAVWLSVVRA